MFGKWSVIIIVSDDGISYLIVQGIHQEADFVGTKRQCLKYVNKQSEL